MHSLGLRWSTGTDKYRPALNLDVSGTQKAGKVRCGCRYWVAPRKHLYKEGKRTADTVSPSQWEQFHIFLACIATELC